MPGLENIAELWQQAADAGYAGGFVAVYRWLSPSSKRSFLPPAGKVAMVAPYPGGWSINSNLPYVGLSYQSIRSGADSAGDNSVPTPPAASGR